MTDVLYNDECDAYWFAKISLQSFITGNQQCVYQPFADLAIADL